MVHIETGDPVVGHLEMPWGHQSEINEWKQRAPVTGPQREGGHQSCAHIEMGDTFTAHE
jgi:hypothetical protein